MLFIIVSVFAFLCFGDNHDSDVDEKHDELIEIENIYLSSALSSDLKQTESPFVLKRGEVCYLAKDSILFENRRVRTGTSFAGPTISVPIVKSLGLRFRAGYFAHAPVVSDELTAIDGGKLVVTNKSIVFIGQKASKTIPLQDIIATSITQSPVAGIPFLVALTRRKGRILFFGMEHPSFLIAAMYRLTSTCGWLNRSEDESVAKIVAK